MENTLIQIMDFKNINQAYQTVKIKTLFQKNQST